MNPFYWFILGNLFLWIVAIIITPSKRFKKPPKETRSVVPFIRILQEDDNKYKD